MGDGATFKQNHTFKNELLFDSVQINTKIFIKPLNEEHNRYIKNIIIYCEHPEYPKEYFLFEQIEKIYKVNKTIEKHRKLS